MKNDCFTSGLLLDDEMAQPNLNIHNLYASEFYNISDFVSFAPSSYNFGTGYTSQFCINITRKGYFTYHSFHHLHEEFRNQILVEKPGCEYSFVQQHSGAGCGTIFRFTETAYQEIKEKYGPVLSSFFSNEAILSMVLLGSAETDFYHHLILGRLAQKSVCSLQMDCVVMELLNSVMQSLVGESVSLELYKDTNQFHLQTIEKAKEYLLENYSKNISLLELSQHCCVSPFHFSRLFKQFCNYSPFQYLQVIRLKHAETLLKTTSLPVSEICYRTGFSRLDYFSAAFAKKYKVSPTKFRMHL